MAMNWMVKKAAVTKYLPLKQEGKTAEEIKAAIAADEKQYKPEEVEEIFAALSEPEDKPKITAKFTVLCGAHIPDQGATYTKEEIEANPDIQEYLYEIGSRIVTLNEQ